MHLDESQLAYLNDAQKARYAKLEKFFETDGWKEVVLYVAEQSELQVKRVLTATSWDMTLVAQGARTAYDHIANLDSFTELEFAALAANAAVAVEEADELEHE